MGVLVRTQHVRYYTAYASSCRDKKRRIVTCDSVLDVDIYIFSTRNTIYDWLRAMTYQHCTSVTTRQALNVLMRDPYWSLDFNCSALDYPENTLYVQLPYAGPDDVVYGSPSNVLQSSRP